MSFVARGHARYSLAAVWEYPHWLPYVVGAFVFSSNLVALKAFAAATYTWAASVLLAGYAARLLLRVVAYSWTSGVWVGPPCMLW